MIFNKETCMSPDIYWFYSAGLVYILQKMTNKCLRICLKLPYKGFEMHVKARLLLLRDIPLLKIMFQKSKSYNGTYMCVIPE